ncbi:MAG: hypothetical protein ABI992_07415 [Chthoniobacterales bacterium]
MNKHILVMTLFAGASLAVAPAQSPTPSPTPSATPMNRCEQNSTSVEVHIFYGSKEIVTEKVANLPSDLSERRVFLQITQSGKTDNPPIEVKLFEQQKDGGFAITEWTRARTPRLFDKLDRAIIQNKGEHCVGEAMKNVLKELGKGERLTPLTPPTSPRDAFAPSVQHASGDFVKTIIIFGC